MPYMVESLKQALPVGMYVLEAKTVLGKALSLSAALNRVIYTLPLENMREKADLLHKVSGILQADTLPIERIGKSETTTVDVRPAIYDIKVDDDILVMTLGIGEGGYARPTEVLELLNIGNDSILLSYSFHRKEMYRHEEDGRKTNAMDI